MRTVYATVLEVRTDADVSLRWTTSDGGYAWAPAHPGRRFQNLGEGDLAITGSHRLCGSTQHEQSGSWRPPLDVMGFDRRQALGGLSEAKRRTTLGSPWWAFVGDRASEHRCHRVVDKSGAYSLTSGVSAGDVDLLSLSSGLSYYEARQDDTPLPCQRPLVAKVYELADRWSAFRLMEGPLGATIVPTRCTG